MKPQQNDGLQAMNQSDVNEYLEGLLKGKQNVEGLEARALHTFKRTSGEATSLESAIGRTEKQLAEMRTRLSKVQGEAGGYANILAMAEDERRIQKIAKEASPPAKLNPDSNGNGPVASINKNMPKKKKANVARPPA